MVDVHRRITWSLHNGHGIFARGQFTGVIIDKIDEMRPAFDKNITPVWSIGRGALRRAGYTRGDSRDVIPSKEGNEAGVAVRRRTNGRGHCQPLCCYYHQQAAQLERRPQLIFHRGGTNDPLRESRVLPELGPAVAKSR